MLTQTKENSISIRGKTPGIRPLLSVTSIKQRQEELLFSFKVTMEIGTLADRAIVTSLCGDYTLAVNLAKDTSHGPAAVIAPVLLGELNAAIRIANSFNDPNLRNEAYALIIDSLLDEGKTREAKDILNRIDLSASITNNTGCVPLPFFLFLYNVSTASGIEQVAYLAGRLNDDQFFGKIKTADAAKNNFSASEFRLRLAFLIGLVKDL